MSPSWNFPARAEPSYEGSEPSRAEPSWGTLISELKPSWKKIFLAIFPKFLLSDFACISCS
jgi:hypothetical protein